MPEIDDYTLIRCVDCEHAVFPSTQTACPGCGRCPSCGLRRLAKVTDCPQCSIPYCACCGRCPQCLGLRYADLDLGPCECGYPEDEARLKEVIRYHALVGAEPIPFSIGGLIVFVVFCIVWFGSLIGLAVWLN